MFKIVRMKDIANKKKIKIKKKGSFDVKCCAKLLKINGIYTC